MKRNANWDSDGKDGGPSSMDVLLQWLGLPGNASRWLEAPAKRDGSRRELSSEISEMLCNHGIPYRTCVSIETKLWGLMTQLDKAEQWLRKRGIGHFDVTKDSERAVLLICPYYRQIAPLLLPSRSIGTGKSQFTNTEAKMQIIDNESSDDGGGRIQEGFNIRHETTSGLQTEQQQIYPRWDADDADGRPSSLDVLLEWLAIPGNAWRSYKAWIERDGSQRELRNEIYESLLSHGITCRTHLAIGTKLLELNKQLIAAEKWLESRGLHRYAVRVCEKTEREVLKICPHYSKISPLFEPPQLSKTTTKRKAQNIEEYVDHNSDGKASSIQGDFTTERVRLNLPSQNVDYTIKWDSDSVGGGPTSLDLLMMWLKRPGNAARLLQSARNRDGMRLNMAKEVRDLFVSHGIKHRSNRTIYSKLCYLTRHFEDAEKWLKMRGISQFDVNIKTERAVLRICPHYREVSPLLRSLQSSATSPQTSSTNRTATTREYRCQDKDNEVGEVFSFDATCDDGPNQNIDYTNTKWDSDGVDGRPSSLNVLLKWILTPGNAARWQEAARKADGSRLALAGEIYDLLLVHGITHRTPRGAESKLRALEKQFDNAENWLMHKGVRHFQDTSEAESVVLQLCPVYSTIGPLLQSARSQTRRNISVDVRFKKTAPKVLAAQLSGSKRVRTEGSQHYTEDINPIVVLEAKPEECQEFFKLELQVKRDEAVLMRAKSRKELFDMGFSAVDVDRLLPL